MGKKTVGVRIDRVPNVIVAGACLHNYALDQGEDAAIEDDEFEDEPIEDDEEPPAALTDAARLAQGLAHRQWLVDQYCQN